MIVSTSMNIPKIVPDDWDRWWDIWQNHSKVLVRTVETHNAVGAHEGFDIYLRKGFAPKYKAPFIDLENLYPSLYEQIMSIPLSLWGVRFIKSYDDFPAHRDNELPNWSLRTMFHCEDPNPQWYYTPRENKNDRTWLHLPEDSNTWAYLDGMLCHGTVFSKQYPKILIQYFAPQAELNAFVKSQLHYKPEYNIEYDPSKRLLVSQQITA